jgi:hypothetical protein
LIAPRRTEHAEHLGYILNAFRLLVGKPVERDYLGEIRVDCRMLLKYNLNKYGLKNFY